MNDPNPYHAPDDAAEDPDSKARPDASGRMLIGSGVFVMAAAFIGALLGALIGGALGTLMPSYYRSVFSNGDSPEFDPVAVGIGQGLTQGTVFGAIVGIALVALHYWHRSRSSAPSAR